MKSFLWTVLAVLVNFFLLNRISTIGTNLGLSYIVLMVVINVWSWLGGRLLLSRGFFGIAIFLLGNYFLIAYLLPNYLAPSNEAFVLMFLMQVFNIFVGWVDKRMAVKQKLLD